MNIVILNMSDDRNKGDLAILESTVGLLRQRYPGCSLSLFNVDYSERELRQPAGRDRLRHLDLKAHRGAFFPRIFTGKGRALDVLRAVWSLLRSLWVGGAVFFLGRSAPALLAGSSRAKIAELARAELVVVKGGGYLYSFGGAAQLLYLGRHLFPALLAVRLKKKVVALGHSIGPFRGRTASALAVYSLRRLDRIAVRDRSSLDLLRSLLAPVASGVSLLPDLAFRGRAAEEKETPFDLAEFLRREGITENGVPRFRIGLTVRRFRRWHFPECSDPERLFENYLRAIVDTIEWLRREQNARVYIMPHALEDLDAGEEVRRRAGKADPFLLRGDYPTATLRRLYGVMDGFIATRIHSALFALGEGTPTLAIGYEMNKAYGIVGRAWEKDAVLDVRAITFDDLRAKMERILKEGKDLRRVISRRVGGLRREIDDSLGSILN